MAHTVKTEDLFKFPRTKHLFDAGGNGVSRDDLLMDPGEEKSFYSPQGRRQRPPQTPVLVAVEEKVDGANLGISIGADMKFTLDVWLAEHSPALYEILEPGRHVLFGEWLYAKHSIHYTRLPGGYFMTFDLYDRKVGRFYSWRERNRRLEGSGIPVVRMIAETTIAGREEALKLLDTASAFYDGPCEGIYLRVDGDMPAGGGAQGKEAEGEPYCVRRTKLVRPDFLQQIVEQWTRQQLTKNIVVYDYDQ